MSRGECPVPKTVKNGLDRTDGKRGAEEDREVWKWTGNKGIGREVEKDGKRK